MNVMRHAGPASAGIALVASILVAGYFLVFDAGDYLRNVTADVYGRFWPKRDWMFLHIASGSLALIAGAAQLLLAFLRRTSSLHRGTGRIYVGAVLISCVASLVVLRDGSVIGPIWVALLVTLAMYVSFFTTRGWIAARRRHWNEHARWMIRSYMSMLVFAWFRLLWELPLLTSMSLGARATTILGLTMMLTLAGTEVALHRGTSSTRAAADGLSDSSPSAPDRA